MAYSFDDASTPSGYQGGDWFGTNAPTEQNGTSGGASAESQIVAAYQEYLGRTPSRQEVLSHTGNGTFQAWDPRLALSIQAIQNSPEAQVYARKKAATTTPTGTPAGTTPPADVAGTIQAILKKYPSNTKGLQEAMAEITALYPKATVVGSSRGDLDLSAYGLGFVDVLEGATPEGGGVRWQWNPIQTGTGGATTRTINPNISSYDQSTFATLRQPFSEVFNPTAWTGGKPYTGPAATDVKPFEYPAYTPGPDFVKPTAADLYEDPSYQVRFAEGQRALQNSAAARGTLMTGGTLKALAKYGQDQASKEYQSVYNRAADTWGLNQQKNLADYQTGFGSAVTGWGLNTGQENTEFNQQRDTWGMENDKAYRDWLANYNRQAEAYRTRYNTWDAQRNFDFNNLYKLAQLGAGSV